MNLRLKPTKLIRISKHNRADLVPVHPPLRRNLLPPALGQSANQRLRIEQLMDHGITGDGRCPKSLKGSKRSRLPSRNTTGQPNSDRQNELGLGGFLSRRLGLAGLTSGRIPPMLLAAFLRRLSNRLFSHLGRSLLNRRSLLNLRSRGLLGGRLLGGYFLGSGLSLRRLVRGWRGGGDVARSLRGRRVLLRDRTRGLWVWTLSRTLGSFLNLRAEVAHRHPLLLDLLDAQREPPALLVNLKNLHVQRSPWLDNLARALDVVIGKLGDMDQTLDPGQDLDEGAEGDDLGHGAAEHVAGAVGADYALPWVLLGLLQTQRDALAVAVDVEHLDPHRVADCHHL